MLVALPVRYVAVFGSLALSLAACAAPESRPAGVGFKLTPAALGESLSLQQRLDVEGHGRSAQLFLLRPQRCHLFAGTFCAGLLAAGDFAQAAQNRAGARKVVGDQLRPNLMGN